MIEELLGNIALSIKQGGWCILGIVTIFALAQLLVVGNAMIANVVDEVLSGKTTDFWGFVIKLFGMVVVGSLLAFVSTFAKSQFAVMVQNDFRDKTASKMLQLEYSYFDKTGSGSVLNFLLL